MLKMPPYKNGGPPRYIWCGPYAVALLLGIHYDQAYAMMMEDARRVASLRVHLAAEDELETAKPEHVKAARKAVRITGTYPHQVERTLRRKGVKCSPFTYYYEGDASPTVLQFLRARPEGTFLIDAARHWIVAHEGMLYHSYLEGGYPERPEPVETPGTPYRRALVRAWAEVDPHPLAYR